MKYNKAKLDIKKYFLLEKKYFKKLFSYKLLN